METMSNPLPVLRGRGVAWNPPNRFERLHVELEPDPEIHADTQILRDSSRSILAFNDSPDVGFDVGVNPYRGCGHGCSYCYARPTHEYLGFSAGLDFETKILVKENAPELLRKAISARGWKPQGNGPLVGWPEYFLRFSKYIKKWETGLLNI